MAPLAPSFSPAEARAFIARIRKEFPDATHNVPAYIIGGGNSVTEYCSYDGEPAGTSGRPALAVLRGSGLGDAALVITRYFGGTLLGKGGLVRAYTEATQLVIQAVPRAHKVLVYVALLALPYSLLEQTRRLAGQHHGDILDETFAADVTLTLRFPLSNFEPFQAGLSELSSGQVQAEVVETKEMLVRVA
jgi:uncharacterized YigZ family protein